MAFVVKKILHNLFKYYITADAIKIKISVLGNTNFVLANMIMIIIIVIIIITFIIIIIVIIKREGNEFIFQCLDHKFRLG